MNNRDFLKRDLYAQIAAGYHDTVGNPNDFVDVLHTVGIFDFGNQPDIVAAQAVELMADFNHIVRRTDKGGCYKIKLVFHRKGQVAQVLFAHVGHVQMDAGHVDSFVGGNHAAVDNLAGNLGVGGLDYPHFHQTVVNEDTRTASHILGQHFIRNGTFLFVAHAILGQQGIGLPGLEGDFRRVKLTGADFRPLRVA